MHRYQEAVVDLVERTDLCSDIGLQHNVHHMIIQ